MATRAQNMPLRYWIYRSRAKVPAFSADSALIYLQSRNRNSADELTGYLHREDDYFVQYVEGPHAAMARLQEAIGADPRHGDIQVIGEGEIPSRRFPGWDMAFTEVERALFRLHQIRHGRDPAIGTATEDDIIDFMESAIQTECATNVRDIHAKAVPR